MKATHKDIKLHGIDLLRGQLIFGRHTASFETGITEQSIRTSLTRLKSTSEITIQSTNKFSIITILNYETYQSNEEKTNQQINQLTNKQLTSNQPATNHIQEHKNIRNKENTKAYPVLPSRDQVLEYFKTQGAQGAEKFFEYYEMVGWVTGPSKKPIKKWQMAASGWIRRNKEQQEKEKVQPYDRLPNQVF